MQSYTNNFYEDVYLKALHRGIDEIDFSDFFVTPIFNLSWAVIDYNMEKQISIRFKLKENGRCIYLNKYGFPMFEVGGKVPDEDIKKALMNIINSLKHDVLVALMADHNRETVTDHVSLEYGTFPKYKLRLNLKALE